MRLRGGVEFRQQIPKSASISFLLADSVTSFVHLRGADNSDDVDDDENTDGDGDDDDHFSAFS